MDPEQLQQLPTAPYPTPPPFWKYFTTENIERFEESTSKSRIPVELTFLRPPPAPPAHTESYTTFSIIQKLDPSPALPPPEIRLFDPDSPTFDHAVALKQLTRSLLLNFLELTTILGNDPIKYQEKIQDIERLMLNVHFVINLYRPHQAREGVKELLQTKLDNGKTEIQECDKMKEKIESFLKLVELQAAQPELNGSTSDQNGEQELSQAQLWDLIHNMDGD